MKKLQMYNFKISVESKHALKIRSKVIDLIMSLTEKKIYKNKRPMMIEISGTGRESSHLYYSSIKGWESHKDFLKVMAARKKPVLRKSWEISRDAGFKPMEEQTE